MDSEAEAVVEVVELPEEAVVVDEAVALVCYES